MYSELTDSFPQIQSYVVREDRHGPIPCRSDIFAGIDRPIHSSDSDEWKAVGIRATWIGVAVSATNP